MAGADPTGSFDAAAFRAGIHTVMSLAAPNNVAEQATFRWLVVDTFAPADPAGHPYDWTATPTVTPAAIADLVVPCAVAFGSDSSSTTDAGEIDQLSAVITLLDTDQQALVAHGGRMPDQVLLKGLVYKVDFIPMPVALFTVDVWTIYVSTEDAEGIGT